MVELLKQGQYVPMPVARQVMVIWAGVNGHLDDIPTGDIGRYEAEFLAFCEKHYPDIEHTLAQEKKISDALEAKLLEATEKFKEKFGKKADE